MLNYVLQQLKVLKLTKFQKHASNNTYIKICRICEKQNTQILAKNSHVKMKTHHSIIFLFYVVCNISKFDVDGQVKVGTFLNRPRFSLNSETSNFLFKVNSAYCEWYYIAKL